MADENKKDEASAKEKVEKEVGETSEKVGIRLLVLGFLTIVIWMSFGLLLEGLIGFRIPAYMAENVRREMFQLAHTHGTLFGVILVIVGIIVYQKIVSLNKIAVTALEMGANWMPVFFLLSGIWPNKEEPGNFIMLAPLGGIMMIFGIINILFSLWKNFIKTVKENR